MALVFVTGAARSGKTRLAMQIASRSGKNVTYVATAPAYPNDADWSKRLRRHRAERPTEWATVEAAVEPRVELAALLAPYGSEDILIVDSLGTWIADELSRNGADRVVECGLDALHAFQNARCSSVVVSEEVGWGVVPAYASGRTFRDVLGVLNQAFAYGADASYLVTAGYALDLKQGAPIATMHTERQAP